MNINRKSGFTLIELLVVIAVIGILSSIVLVSLNSARRKANATKAKQDLSQIAKAVQMAYNEGCAGDSSVTLNTPVETVYPGIYCTSNPSQKFMAKTPVPPSGFSYAVGAKDGSASWPFAGTGQSRQTMGEAYDLRISGFSDGGVYICDEGTCACNKATGCKE